jgi:hypothetical protein
LLDDRRSLGPTQAPRSARFPARAAGALLTLCIAYPVASGLASGSASDASQGESVAARGQAVLAPFKSALQSALRAGLAEEGPVHAIGVCRDDAPALAARASTGGVRVGRTSHKLRNPRNAPEPWMEPLLAHYLEEPDARAPRTVSLEGGRAGYVEPIFVQAPCLACHGESLAPGVAERLAELYPEDRATGFEVGDFRGLFWAELPASP